MQSRPAPWVFAASLVFTACSEDSTTPDTTGAGAHTLNGPTSTGSAGGTASNTTTGSTTSGSGGAGGNGVGGAVSNGGNGGSGGSGPTGLVRFVAIGDAGKGNAGQAVIGDAIAAKCALSGCDFVQLLGDNIYDSGAESPTDAIFATNFEQPYAAVDLPFWVVLGNHDYGGDGTGFDLSWGFGKAQNEIDYSLNSTKWKLPSAYYHHTLSHAELFAFDTNLWMWNQAGDQATDVPGWIKQSTAAWKIGIVTTRTSPMVPTATPATTKASRSFLSPMGKASKTSWIASYAVR